jgi:hypothetical protein
MTKAIRFSPAATTTASRLPAPRAGSGARRPSVSAREATGTGVPPSGSTSRPPTARTSPGPIRTSVWTFVVART